MNVRVLHDGGSGDDDGIGLPGDPFGEADMMTAPASAPTTPWDWRAWVRALVQAVSENTEDVAGACFVLAVLCGLAWLCRRWRRRRLPASASHPPNRKKDE